MSAAVVTLQHPSTELEQCRLKAKRSEYGIDILWAYFEVREAGAKPRRVWVERPGEDGNFWKAIEARGYDAPEASMAIGEWIDREESVRDIL